MTVDTEPAATPRSGRPRSEPARQAVLEAVDDLLVERGYAAMTMKGIAERAGVGRQTVYRWWSTKAEILLEACTQDAGKELTIELGDDPVSDLLTYLNALTTFLTTSPAGLSYRALLGEAQGDPIVRDLLQHNDLLSPSAVTVLVRIDLRLVPALELATAQLVGPVLARVLTGPTPLSPALLREHVAGLVRAWSGEPHRP